MVEIFAFLQSDALWGGPHAYTGHLPIDYIMQSKTITLFILKRLSTSNTLFFTSLTMYLYKILFCSLIL